MTTKILLSPKQYDKVIVENYPFNKRIRDAYANSIKKWHLGGVTVFGTTEDIEIIKQSVAQLQQST